MVQLVKAKRAENIPVLSGRLVNKYTVTSDIEIDLIVIGSFMLIDLIGSFVVAMFTYYYCVLCYLLRYNCSRRYLIVIEYGGQFVRSVPKRFCEKGGKSRTFNPRNIFQFSYRLSRFQPIFWAKKWILSE